MRVLQKYTCKTLSGKSTLSYQIGATPDSVIHIRITKNDGGGFFSDEWIAYEDIQAALKKRLKGQAITSFLLIPVFSGKSANNSSFLASILKHLKLIEPLKGKQREHELMDPRPFLDQVDKLMSSSEKTSRKTPTKKTVRKTNTKKSIVKNTPVRKASTKKAAIKKRSVSKLKKTSTN